MNDEALSTCCKALGHPARLHILDVLLKQGACVCGELVQATPLAQSTVSQHLKVLKKAGLVQGTVTGPSVCYCVDPAVLLAVGEELVRRAQTMTEDPCASTSTCP